MINLLDGFPFLVVELGSRKDVLVWLGEDGGEDWEMGKGERTWEMMRSSWRMRRERLD